MHPLFEFGFIKVNVKVEVEVIATGPRYLSAKSLQQNNLIGGYELAVFKFRHSRF